MRQDGIVENGVMHDETGVAPVFADIGNAGAFAALNARGRERRTFKRDVALSHTACTPYGFQETGAATADHAIKTHDFTGAHRKIDGGADRADAESGKLQNGVARRARIAMALVAKRLARHERDDLVARGIGDLPAAHGPAIAQHCVIIGQREYLVEPVRHEDDGTALIGQIAHDAAQDGRLLLAERGGGFVEDQHPRIVHQRAQDFDNLALGDREATNRHVDVEIEPVAVPQGGKTRAHRLPVDAAKTAWIGAAHIGVFIGREARDEIELLMHGAQPGGFGSSGAGGFISLA